jgi:hypothetical protein
MPTVKKNADVESAAGQEPDVAATAAGTGADGAIVGVPPDVPNTAATRALWAALSTNAGATAVELAEIADVSRSTANKALAVMEEAGCAKRTAGGREGSKRLPDRWQALLPDHGPVAAVSTDTAAAEQGAETEVPRPDPEQRESAESPDAAVQGAEAAAAESLPSTSPVADAAPADQESDRAGTGDSARLRPGALREMVIGYLRERPDQELSPSAIGKGLERSSGAVANACDRLMTDGAIVQTSEKPRRYRLASGGA